MLLRGVVVLALVLAFGTVASAQTPIVLSSWAAPEAWEAIGAVFQEDHPEYRLEYQARPGSDVDDLLVLLIAGTVPDVVQLAAQTRLAFVEIDALLDLAPYWERSEIVRNANLFPFVIDAVSRGNEIHGIPYDFSTITWFVDLDALASAGLPVPDPNWTVADLRDYAIRLTRRTDNVVTQYGTNFMVGGGNVHNWQWGRNFVGQGWLTDDFTGVTIEDPRYVAMIEYWLELGQAGATQLPGFPAPARGDIFTGGYAMWQGWSHYGDRIQGYDWAMANFPVGPAGGNHFAHTHLLSIPKDADDPDKSWVFLEWLLSPKGQRTMVQIGVRQPLSPDPSLWEIFTQTVPANKRELLYHHVIDTIYLPNRVDMMQYWPTWPEVSSIMNQRLNPVWRGQEDPRSAMIRAAEQIRAILAGR